MGCVSIWRRTPGDGRKCSLGRRRSGLSPGGWAWRARCHGPGGPVVPGGVAGEAWGLRCPHFGLREPGVLAPLGWWGLKVGTRQSQTLDLLLSGRGSRPALASVPRLGLAWLRPWVRLRPASVPRPAPGGPACGQANWDRVSQQISGAPSPFGRCGSRPGPGWLRSPWPRLRPFGLRVPAWPPGSGPASGSRPVPGLGFCTSQKGLGCLGDRYPEVPSADESSWPIPGRAVLGGELTLMQRDGGK